MSWRRSLLSGVDTASSDLPLDKDAAPPGRLIKAARPVLDRLAGEIAGARAWAFLAEVEVHRPGQRAGFCRRHPHPPHVIVD